MLCVMKNLPTLLHRPGYALVSRNSHRKECTLQHLHASFMDQLLVKLTKLINYKANGPMNNKTKKIRQKHSYAFHT